MISLFSASLDSNIYWNHSWNSYLIIKHTLPPPHILGLSTHKSEKLYCLFTHSLYKYLTVYLWRYRVTKVKESAPIKLLFVEENVFIKNL
jgi:hypothetical protein